MKIKKLTTNFYSEEHKEKYQKEKRDFIAGYKEWRPGGFLSSGSDVSNPEVAEAKWKGLYPRGFMDWITTEGVNGHGGQEIVDKVNEVIDFLNKKKGRNKHEK